MPLKWLATCRPWRHLWTGPPDKQFGRTAFVMTHCINQSGVKHRYTVVSLTSVIACAPWRGGAENPYQLDSILVALISSTRAASPWLYNSKKIPRPNDQPLAQASCNRVSCSTASHSAFESPMCLSFVYRMMMRLVRSDYTSNETGSNVIHVQCVEITNTAHMDKWTTPCLAIGNQRGTKAERAPNKRLITH